MILSEKSLRNVFVYLAPRLINDALYIITLPILARLLSPEDFGISVLAIVFPTIVVGVITAGLASAVARYYFEYRQDLKRLNALYFSVQIYLFIGLIVSALVVYFAKSHISLIIMNKSIYGNAVFIAYLSSYINYINTLYLQIYQCMEKAVTQSLFFLLQSLSGIIISFILIWRFKMTYMGLIYGPFIGAVVACAIIVCHFNFINVRTRIDFDKALLLESVKYGLQLVPKTFTGFINKFFDKYLLNSMLSMTTVGIYNIGQSFANVFFVFMGNVWQAFQPSYFREVFDKGESASFSVGKIFSIFSYITLFPILLGILFAEEFIHLLFPPAYNGATEIIIVLALGVTTQTFGMYLSVQYAYSKKPFWIFPVSVAGTILNVLINIYLIPRYGLLGAGLATVASVSGTNFILTYIGQKLYKIQYEWRTIIPLFVTIIAGVIVTLLGRSMQISFLYLLPIKVAFVSGFVYVGIKSKIVSSHSIRTAAHSLFRASQKAA